MEKDKQRREKMKEKIRNNNGKNKRANYSFWIFAQKHPTMTPILVSIATTIIMRLLFKIFL
ncbi:hypothetical protein [Fusobacterium ulcerans]|uniref:hypothetical protein n=1 Tax=Fusobacterium ulcerans TaxID=861 RepID=UPI0010322D81|nr:hypothetical protein [Fusobacterium ulcerans]